jgi:hypothetical protein
MVLLFLLATSTLRVPGLTPVLSNKVILNEDRGTGKAVLGEGRIRETSKTESTPSGKSQDFKDQGWLLVKYKLRTQRCPFKGGGGGRMEGGPNICWGRKVGSKQIQSRVPCTSCRSQQRALLACTWDRPWSTSLSCKSVSLAKDLTLKGLFRVKSKPLNKGQEIPGFNYGSVPWQVTLCKSG